MERLTLTIAGRVQGVWYRASTRQEAERLGLVGWVRNLADGRVEAMAEGPRGALKALAAWCRTGPPLARVTDVALVWGEPTGEWSSFTIRRR